MGYLNWVVSIELCALFLSYFSNSYSINDENISNFQGCPALDANKHIEIIRASVFYKSRQKIDIFMKSPYDPKYITTHLNSFLIPEEIDIFKNNLDQIEISYSSAIWLEERNLFLAAAYISLFDAYCFIYTTFFDFDWNEIRDEDYIGNTKVPGILAIETKMSGPEGPRIFEGPKGEVFLVFNMLTKDLKRKMYMYNYLSATFKELKLEEHVCSGQVSEKNWIPIIVDELRIYFIYNYKNLQVIDCSEENEACIMVRGGYDNKLNSIRGGSPYVRFGDTNYFVSFIYTNVNADAPELKCKPYRPALSIIEYIEGEKPDFKLIYTSEPLDFGNKVFLSPVSQYKSIKEILDCNFSRVLIVNSISKWNYNEDLVDLTLTVFDRYALTIRVKGITELIQYIINAYEYGRIEQKEDCAIWLAFNYHKQLWPRHLFNTNKFAENYMVVNNKLIKA